MQLVYSVRTARRISPNSDGFIRQSAASFFRRHFSVDDKTRLGGDRAAGSVQERTKAIGAYSARNGVSRDMLSQTGVWERGKLLCRRQTMSASVTVDLVANDEINNEYQLYLFEYGPWKMDDSEMRLVAIQTRIYDTIDVITSGLLAKNYPDSTGIKCLVVLQCDSDISQPYYLKIAELVSIIGKFIDITYNKSSPESANICPSIRLTAEICDED